MSTFKLNEHEIRIIIMEAFVSAAVQSYHARSLDRLESAIPRDIRENLLEVFIEIAKEVDDCGSLHTQCSELDSYIDCSRRQKLFLDGLLRKLGKPHDGLHVIDILETWGMFSKHENIAIWTEELQERSHIDSKVEKAARNLLKVMSRNPLSLERKEDLRNITSFAIDKISTRDVDDAISYIPQKNSVLVHITDPAEYVGNNAEHVLMKDASKRLLSIYSCHEKFPMFPEEVSTQLFSLRSGRKAPRYVMTFEFQISNDGEISKNTMNVYASVISDPVCLSYEEASEIMKNKSHRYYGALNKLYSLSEKRRDWRHRVGGARQYDTNIHDSSGAKAHLLVDEMMISANTVAAHHAKKHGIPVLYRGVPPRRGNTKPRGSTFRGTRYTFSMYGTGTKGRDMEKGVNVKINTWPMQHAGLGVEGYVQATSPLRKFSDLIVHFQFNSMFRKQQLPFSAERLMRLKGPIVEMERAAARIGRRAKKYWVYHQLGKEVAKLHQGILLRILKQKVTDARERNNLPLKTEVSRGYENNNVNGTEWVVFLTKFKIDISAVLPFRGKSGMEVYVRVEEVNPRSSYLRARVLKAKERPRTNRFTQRSIKM